jgi:hypothetical protein
MAWASLELVAKPHSLITDGCVAVTGLRVEERR